jgi:hypothetical protein
MKRAEPFSSTCNSSAQQQRKPLRLIFSAIAEAMIGWADPLSRPKTRPRWHTSARVRSDVLLDEVHPSKFASTLKSSASRHIHPDVEQGVQAAFTAQRAQLFLKE